MPKYYRVEFSPKKGRGKSCCAWCFQIDAASATEAERIGREYLAQYGERITNFKEPRVLKTEEYRNDD